MRTVRTWVLIAATGATACQPAPTTIVAPESASEWIGPPVVASVTDRAAVAELAKDPWLGDLFGSLPEPHDREVVDALDHVAIGVVDAPEASFDVMERTRTALSAEPGLSTDADAEITLATLDLYQEWVSKTLFGVGTEGHLPPQDPPSEQ